MCRKGVTHSLKNLDLFSPKVHPVHPLRHTIPHEESSLRGSSLPAVFKLAADRGTQNYSENSNSF